MNTVDIEHHAELTISRADRVAEVALTSWGEQSETRAVRVARNTSFSLLDFKAPAGFGPPRHLHFVQEEVFLIHRGKIVVWTPETHFTLGPGDVVCFPQNAAHTWRAYGDEPVHFTVIVSPSSKRGLEHFFDRVVDRNLTLSDTDKLVETAEASGMQIVGPPLTDAEVAAIRAGKAVH